MLIFRRAKASYRIPALPHICHSSRTFESHVYRPCFERELGHPICFNLSTDILLIGDGTAFAGIRLHSGMPVDCSEFQQVQNLAISGHWGERNQDIDLKLYHFEALERLLAEKQSS
jgi:hypothetical protein